eukprot:6213548-Pleurochrysis_carterae.AAC.1
MEDQARRRVQLVNVGGQRDHAALNGRVKRRLRVQHFWQPREVVLVLSNRQRQRLHLRKGSFFILVHARDREEGVGKMTFAADGCGVDPERKHPAAVGGVSQESVVAVNELAS